MGLTIVLQDENGHPIDYVEDSQNLLHRLLPSSDDNSYPLLRFVDWYGDTVFNRLQMQEFGSEWGRITQCATTRQDNELLVQVKELAERCQSEPHLYLKFVGD